MREKPFNLRGQYEALLYLFELHPLGVGAEILKDYLRRIHKASYNKALDDAVSEIDWHGLRLFKDGRMYYEKDAAMILLRDLRK